MGERNDVSAGRRRYYARGEAGRSTRVNASRHMRRQNSRTARMRTTFSCLLTLALGLQRCRTCVGYFAGVAVPFHGTSVPNACARVATLALAVTRAPRCSAQLAEGEECDPAFDECDIYAQLVCADDGMGGYSCQGSTGCCGVELTEGAPCEPFSAQCSEDQGMYCYDPNASGHGVCTPDCCSTDGALCDLERVDSECDTSISMYGLSCLDDGSGQGECQSLDSPPPPPAGGSVRGCTDASADNYDESATEDDGSCQYPATCADISGDGDLTADVFDCSGEHQSLDPDPASKRCAECLSERSACEADSSCAAVRSSNDFGACAGNARCSALVACMQEGCTADDCCTASDSPAPPPAGGSVRGCTDASADNYDESATEDDGSCQYPSSPPPLSPSPSGADGEGGGSDSTVSGCTDASADNYDESATEDDGSCQYPATCADISG
eukprot:COSAG02_NODE_1246_length_13659_cov_23.906858_1_plen_441_part_10